MPDLPPHWQKLDKIASSYAIHPDEGWLRVETRSQVTAITLAHSLTLQLDQANGLYTPSDKYAKAGFTLEGCFAKAKERIAQNRAYIFGEELPAWRNMAVRVEGQYLGVYAVVATIRDELAAKPELKGGELLREGFLAALDIVEF